MRLGAISVRPVGVGVLLTFSPRRIFNHKDKRKHQALYSAIYRGTFWLRMPRHALCAIPNPQASGLGIPMTYDP